MGWFLNDIMNYDDECKDEFSGDDDEMSESDLVIELL